MSVSNLVHCFCNFLFMNYRNPIIYFYRYFVCENLWNMDQIKQYYTTVFSVAYSSCGYYLAAASNYGTIAIFKLELIYFIKLHCYILCLYNFWIYIETKSTTLHPDTAHGMEENHSCSNS